MQKRGQFFLMAALLIIGVLIGLVSVVNYARINTENKQFYDLGKEIGFEAKQVLDYGTYASDEVSSGTLLRSLISNYSSYISRDQVFFIYGNSTNISAYYFDETYLGSVGFSTGGEEPVDIPSHAVQPHSANVQEQEGILILRVNGIDYRFTLRPGQNFYFVLIKESDDNRFVTTG